MKREGTWEKPHRKAIRRRVPPLLPMLPTQRGEYEGRATGTRLSTSSVTSLALAFV